MTTLGKVAEPIGSVEETRLVDTVDVVNWVTVLGLTRLGKNNCFTVLEFSILCELVKI